MSRARYHSGRHHERPTIAGIGLLGALAGLAFAGAILLPGSAAPSSCGPEEDGVVDRLDVDADGRDDEVFWGYDDGELVLRVCTVAGQRSSVFGRGMGEAYFEVDVGPDGRPEFLVGGNTVSMAETDVVVFRHGRLEAVVGPGGERLAVVGGSVHGEDGLVEDRSWGCDDVTGDGRRELTQATVAWRTDGLAHVTIEAYRLDGARAAACRFASLLIGRCPVRSAWPDGSLGPARCLVERASRSGHWF